MNHVDQGIECEVLSFAGGSYGDGLRDRCDAAGLVGVAEGTAALVSDVEAMAPVPGEDDRGVFSAPGRVGDDARGHDGEAVGELHVGVASRGDRKHLAEHLLSLCDVVAADGVEDENQSADEVSPETGGRTSGEVEVGDDGAHVVVAAGEVEGDGEVELEV